MNGDVVFAVGLSVADVSLLLRVLDEVPVESLCLSELESRGVMAEKLESLCFKYGVLKVSEMKAPSLSLEMCGCDAEGASELR